MPSPFPNPHFSDITLCAIKAALQAGELLKRGLHTQYAKTLKGISQNFVTDFDLAAEKCIVDIIYAHFPKHTIFAEESGHKAPKDGPDAVRPITWIIDPLDGTTNFVHRLPYFAVSIAAIQDDTILTGVIYIPMLDELFAAERGQGAYLNNAPLHVSETDSLDEILAVTGFPYTMKENPMGCINFFVKWVKMGLPIRDLGSAAIGLAYVAAGRFDAYWMASQDPWDRAAGSLLIQEAGGSVSQYDKSPLPLLEPASLLATNGRLHSNLSALLLS